MSKHHHQNKEEQINNRIKNRIHNRARIQQESMPFQKNRPMQSENIQIDNSSIQLLAYQIYQENGGPALDNWLEAEQILRNSNLAVSDFLNEGNSNT